MFQTNVVEKIKTRILCSIFFFFYKNRSVYEMWENMIEPDKCESIIRRMRIACWMTKATDTHSEYVTFIALPRQRGLRERSLLFPRTLLSITNVNFHRIGLNIR